MGPYAEDSSRQIHVNNIELKNIFTMIHCWRCTYFMTNQMDDFRHDLLLFQMIIMKTFSMIGMTTTKYICLVERLCNCLSIWWFNLNQLTRQDAKMYFRLGKNRMIQHWSMLKCFKMSSFNTDEAIQIDAIDFTWWSELPQLFSHSDPNYPSYFHMLIRITPVWPIENFMCWQCMILWRTLLQYDLWQSLRYFRVP